MMKGNSILFLSFCSFVFLGQWLMTDAWNGVVYIYVGEDRAPAAVKNLSDYYPVSNKFLRKPMEEQLFGNVAFVSRQNELGVQVGNFLTFDSSGNRRFACHTENRGGVFNRVELSFVGVGVSDDGRIPKMTVNSNCAAEDDLTTLSPIWIPMGDIYQAEPKTQELHFPEFGSTAIHFENLASTWPERWALVKVRLYNSESGSVGVLLEPKTKSHAALSFDWH